MAQEPGSTKRTRKVGHISYDARMRVDRRVKQILDRREAAVKRARRAAATPRTRLTPPPPPRAGAGRKPTQRHHQITTARVQDGVTAGLSTPPRRGERRVHP
jgi:hypothetical protein